VLSQLLRAIMGKGAFYWLSISSILVVLSLSANTASMVGFAAASAEVPAQ